MKYLAFIFSFYIISLSAMPMVKLMQVGKGPDSCAEKCCKHMPEKDADGCDGKACSPFSCCLKTPIVFNTAEDSLNRFIPESTVKNNFSYKEMFVFQRNFDIWHPPRIGSLLFA